MVIDNLQFLEKNKVAFWHASWVAGVLRAVGTEEKSEVPLDMQECVQHWRKVRLGRGTIESAVYPPSARIKKLLLGPLAPHVFMSSASLIQATAQAFSIPQRSLHTD